MERKQDTNETIIALAVPQSASVRTTIPKNIAKKLGLAPGVHVVWDIDKIDNEWVAVIKKIATTPSDVL